MGAGGEDLVVLEENPQARPAGRHAGLYHFALLHPSREELASALQRLAITRTPMQGASDHGVSEALYLPDPDENGIELYADRPREVWPRAGPGGKVGMFTEPLDVEDLLAPRRDPSRRATPAPGSRSATCTCTWRHGRVDALLPRRDRLRADGRAARRRLRVGGRLPPPPRLQQLARPGRAARAAGDAVGSGYWTLLLDGEDELAPCAPGIDAAGMRGGGARRGPRSCAIPRAPRSC